MQGLEAECERLDALLAPLVSATAPELVGSYGVGTDTTGALLDSAELLNSRMREIRDSGKVVGLDRIAVMAALNITNELLRTKGRDETLETDVTDRLRSLRERVESALANGQQLEL